jgi:hypothetical protein
MNQICDFIFIHPLKVMMVNYLFKFVIIGIVRSRLIHIKSFLLTMVYELWEN